MAKVMVVDDSAFMRRRCVSLVKELGYEAVEAADGRQAIEAYRRIKPHAVLMDIAMPGVDGLAALREIRALDPSAKVIMVTALGQQAMLLKAIRAGAKDFVVKPFQLVRLKETLEKLVGSQQGTQKG